MSFHEVRILVRVWRLPRSAHHRPLKESRRWPTMPDGGGGRGVGEGGVGEGNNGGQGGLRRRCKVPGSQWGEGSGWP